MEILGLIATILIVLSMCFKNIKIIRFINLIGSVCFVIYGLSIGALYTWIANTILIFVQIYYLIKIYKEERNK